MSSQAENNAAVLRDIQTKMQGLDTKLDILTKYVVEQVNAKLEQIQTTLEEAKVAIPTQQATQEALFVGPTPAPTRPTKSSKQVLQDLLETFFSRNVNKRRRNAYRYFYGNTEVHSAVVLMEHIGLLISNMDASQLETMLPIIFPDCEQMTPTNVKARIIPNLGNIFISLNTKDVKESNVQQVLCKEWLLEGLEKGANSTSQTSQRRRRRNLSAMAPSTEQEIPVLHDYLTGAVDTSTTMKPLTPAAKYPEDDDANKTTYKFSGKPDLSSIYAPMWLEMKCPEKTSRKDLPPFDPKTRVSYDATKDASALSMDMELENHDFDCIYQALERVDTMATLNDLLKVIVSFSTCGMNATLCCIITKEYDSTNNDKVINQSLYVFPIHYNEIIPLWRSINYLAIYKPHCIFHVNETIMISRCLNNMLPKLSILDLAFCRVKLISNPSHALVYEIVLYDVNEGGVNVVDIGENSKPRTIVIKLPHFGKGVQRNFREVNSLLKIKDIHASDFVIGIQQFDLNSEHTMSHRLQLMPPSISNVEAKAEESTSPPGILDAVYEAMAKEVLFTDREQNPFTFFDCEVESSSNVVEEIAISFLEEPFMLPIRPPSFSVTLENLNPLQYVKTCSLLSQTDYAVSKYNPFLRWWTRFGYTPLQLTDVDADGKIGAIVMFRGEAITKPLTGERQFLMESILKEMHQLHIFHTDIRPANVLEFPTLFDYSFQKKRANEEIEDEISRFHVRIIDFDHAEEFDSGTGTLQLSPGNRLKIISEKVGKVNPDNTIAWNGGNELKMWYAVCDYISNECKRRKRSQLQPEIGASSRDALEDIMESAQPSGSSGVRSSTSRR